VLTIPHSSNRVTRMTGTVKAVQAALAYYWRHQTIIDGRLAEHAAFFEPTPS
jgi:hypothetical protein